MPPTCGNLFLCSCSRSAVTRQLLSVWEYVKHGEKQGCDDTHRSGKSHILECLEQKSLTGAGLFAFDGSQEREVKAASGCVC